VGGGSVLASQFLCEVGADGRKTKAGQVRDTGWWQGLHPGLPASQPVPVPTAAAALTSPTGRPPSDDFQKNIKLYFEVI